MRDLQQCFMDENSVVFIGVVRSTLTHLDDCPRQESEGAPDAWLDVEPNFTPGLEGIVVGDELLVFTWLHKGRRDLLRIHPRGDPQQRLTGVFATRSPDRPNPIGLHRVKVLALDGRRVQVGPLEVLDGTPIVDLKPMLRGLAGD
jgi:tRNA-Thr(GGU) m(6)t(6)A37 methyltransferase TsaA